MDKGVPQVTVTQKQEDPWMRGPMGEGTNR